MYSAGNDGSVRQWDPTSLRELGWRLQFSAHGWASVDLERNLIYQMEGDAWRWVARQALDPTTGLLERSPAAAPEAFSRSDR